MVINLITYTQASLSFHCQMFHTDMFLCIELLYYHILPCKGWCRWCYQSHRQGSSQMQNTHTSLYKTYMRFVVKYLTCLTCLTWTFSFAFNHCSFAFSFTRIRIFLSIHSTDKIQGIGARTTWLEINCTLPCAINLYTHHHHILLHKFPILLLLHSPYFPAINFQH